MTDDDVDAVLALNEESVKALSPMVPTTSRSTVSLTPYASVCEVDSEVAAFAIAYPPGTSYDSVNYLWHADRFDDFLYLDRIAVRADIGDAASHRDVRRD